MRLFIAIDLPKNIKTNLARIQKELAPHYSSLKWIKPENIHLTLKFLGETNHKKLEQVKTAIIEVSKNHKPFTLSLADFGFFPKTKNPRIFFIKAQPEKELKDIADDLEQNLEGLGFKQEHRFKSHITLARIKGEVDTSSLKEKLANVKVDGTFEVTHLTLFQSTLTNKAPIYEAIFTVTLTR